MQGKVERAKESLAQAASIRSQLIGTKQALDTAEGKLHDQAIERRSFISCPCPSCVCIRDNRNLGYVQRLIRNIKRNE